MNIVEVFFYTLILWGAVFLTNTLSSVTEMPTALAALCIVLVFVISGDLAARLRRSQQEH
jgi:hypothetical protein